MVDAHGQESRELRRHSGPDDVGLVAINSIQRLNPNLREEPDFMLESGNTPFGVVRTQSPVVRIEPYKTAVQGWLNPPRPAGYDSGAGWVTMD